MVLPIRLHFSETSCIRVVKGRRRLVGQPRLHVLERQRSRADGHQCRRRPYFLGDRRRDPGWRRFELDRSGSAANAAMDPSDELPGSRSCSGRRNPAASTNFRGGPGPG